MSKYDKLLERVRKLDKDLRFDELSKVMSKCGYRMESPMSGSSHYTFRRNGFPPLTIPKHVPIKPPYIKKVKKLLELIEMEENNDD